MKNEIEIYETDTAFSAKGYCVTGERWAELKGVASYNRKQPLSYAIHTALSAVESAARKLIAARAAKISNAVPTYACAGRPNGCPARVSTPNSFCASCAHDEE